MGKFYKILIGIMVILLIALPFIYNHFKKLDVENIEEEGFETLDITEENAEDIIIQMLESEKEIEVSTIMKTVSLLDFDKLAETHGDESVLKTLNWLETKDIEGVENILILINLVDEFIGQEYFSYIQSVANSYINHKMDFIKALAQDPEKLQSVAYALNSMRVYSIGGQDMWKDLDKITKSEDLSDTEKKVGIELIQFYSACGT